MINIQDIFKLCDEYIINIDRFNNNLILAEGSLCISNCYFILEVPSHTFKFKIVPLGTNNLVKIMCMSSFKWLTCDNNNDCYFVDYFVETDDSVFYGVWDEINLCLFPRKNSKLILCYTEALCFKDVQNDIINVDDQTIFLYEQNIYSDLVYLSTLDNIYNCQYIRINNIQDIFKFITESYSHIPNILLQLSETPIPAEFFINNSPTILDRKIDLRNMAVYKRNTSYTSLIDYDIHCQNTKMDHYDKETQIVEHLLPKYEHVMLVLTKILKLDNVGTTIFFNKNGVYYVTPEQVHRRDVGYYMSILELLRKKNNDNKIYNLLQFSLFYILYNEY
jgi:hypothetical protein